jgi:hypothetical protein
MIKNNTEINNSYGFQSPTHPYDSDQINNQSNPNLLFKSPFSENISAQENNSLDGFFLFFSLLNFSIFFIFIFINICSCFRIF